VSRPLADAFPEIRARVREAARVALFLDFDGTLAPVVERPEEAALPGETRDLLLGAARDPRCAIAVVSGRSLRDLIPRVGIEGIHYAGNHGAEIQGPRLERRDALAEEIRRELESVGTRLASDLRDLAGVLVEPKGFSTAVHVRRASRADAARARAAVRAAIGDGSGRLAIREGKEVSEILPRGGSTKGDAVRAILEAVRPEGGCLAIVVGDDETDEDAFAALPGSITIRVGLSGASRATYHLGDAAEVTAALRVILDELEGGGGVPTGASL
jgi:trehalose 6-phosphate phosphatase